MRESCYLHVRKAAVAFRRVLVSEFFWSEAMAPPPLLREYVFRSVCFFPIGIDKCMKLKARFSFFSFTVSPPPPSPILPPLSSFLRFLLTFPSSVSAVSRLSLFKSLSSVALEPVISPSCLQSKPFLLFSFSSVSVCVCVGGGEVAPFLSYVRLSRCP